MVDLPSQFIVSKKDVPAPEEWRTARLLGWQLQYHPTVRVRSLLDDNGNRIGWLTHLPTLNGTLVEEHYRVETSSDLHRLGGTWTAFLLDRGRVYLSPFGHPSLVYSGDAGVVATNPELVPGADRDEVLVSLMNIPAENNWFPFGLTPRVGVHRLLPNHYLDLDTWHARRHWPTGEEREPISVEEAAQIAARVVKQNIAAVEPHYRLYLSLTAGYDSRAILACVRDRADQLEFYTHDDHSWTSDLDMELGTHLARRQNLNHTAFRVGGTTERQEQEALYRTGWSVRVGRREDYLQTPHNLLKVLGIGGEVLSALSYYGPPGRLAEPTRLAKKPTPRDLLECLKLPSNEVVLRAAKRWLEGIATDDPRAILDLLFVEQRLGCWAAPVQYKSVSATFWPLAHRDVLDVMLRLPTEAKLEYAVHRRVIEREWPALLELPVNEWWGWHKATKGLSHVGHHLWEGNLSYLLSQLRVRIALRTRMRRWLQGSGLRSK